MKDPKAFVTNINNENIFQTTVAQLCIIIKVCSKFYITRAGLLCGRLFLGSQQLPGNRVPESLAQSFKFSFLGAAFHIN